MDGRDRGKIEGLPKWVQNHIRDLQREIHTLKQVRAPHEGSSSIIVIPRASNLVWVDLEK